MQPRLVLIKSSFQGSATVSVTRKPHFRATGLHGHDFYELDIITAGSIPATLNGNCLTASAGAVFFLTPEDMHDYLPADEEIDILNIQFQGKFVSDAVLHPLVESGKRVFVLEGEALRSFEAICNLLEMYCNTKNSSAEILWRLLEAALLMLDKDKTEETAPPTADMPRALTYIHEHFKENPPLSALASLLSLDERYFCAKFKEYTGKSYKEYLRERKLSYAKRLLLSSTHSVTEIALECGYGTTSHFNREFKAHFGTTPLAMRRGTEKKG